MGSFWDERARENAAYFVDSTLDYRRPDLDRFWASGPEALDLILRMVGAPPIQGGDRVVEIGCGIGRLTRPLAARAGSVRAIDVSAAMLDRARSHNPDLANVEWIHGEGDRLTGIGDASADVVFSHVVFQHVPDPAITLAYVRDMGRVLRPGGWAAFQVSNDAAVHRPPRRTVRDRLAAALRRAPRGRADPAWLGSAVSLADLEAAAREGGLAVERVVGEGTQFCLVLLRSAPDAPPGA